MSFRAYVDAVHNHKAKGTAQEFGVLPLSFRQVKDRRWQHRSLYFDVKRDGVQCDLYVVARVVHGHLPYDNPRELSPQFVECDPDRITLHGTGVPWISEAD